MSEGSVPSDAASVVAVERRGPVAVIHLQRPIKRNAVNQQMTNELSAALDALDDDTSVAAMVIAGGDDVFCAGTDLIEGSGEPTPRGGEYGVIRRRRRTPLIAAVEGGALGGGFEIVMTCDMVVASTSAWFALPEVRRGVVATSGALFRAHQVLPLNIVRELLLTGRTMPSEEATRLGFVNRLVPPGEAVAAAVQLAQDVAANSGDAVTATLEAMDAVTRRDDDHGWEITAEAKDAILHSADMAEGIQAFSERRSPQWPSRQ
jgi:enoyl-CoA hydratase